MTARATVRALAGVPAAILAASYLWLAADHGTAWLFPVVVHEGGRHTLGDTVLYWRHFLRELPVVVAYTAASVTAVAVYGPRRTAAPSRRTRAIAACAAALLVATAWVATANAHGTDVAWRELAQAHLADDDARTSGAHWRFHLLSTLAYPAAAVVLAAALQRLLDGRVRAPARRARARGLAILAAAIAAPTLAWGLGAEPFVDARHLGHQAREAATHLAITLPLSFAALLAVGRPGGGTVAGDGRSAGRELALWAGGGGAVLAYLGIGSLVTGAPRAARPAALSSLVGAHGFEHALDYALVTLLATACAPAPCRSGGGA